MRGVHRRFCHATRSSTFAIASRSSGRSRAIISPFAIPARPPFLILACAPVPLPRSVPAKSYASKMSISSSALFNRGVQLATRLWIAD